MDTRRFTDSVTVRRSTNTTLDGGFVEESFADQHTCKGKLILKTPSSMVDHAGQIVEYNGVLFVKPDEDIRPRIGTQQRDMVKVGDIEYLVHVVQQDNIDGNRFRVCYLQALGAPH